MANMCDFYMCVKGERENIEDFFQALIQEGNVWIGRGADAGIAFEGDNMALIDGTCKWSIYSALVSNAVSMRESQDTWYFTEEEKSRGLEFITLFEACAKWNITMEVYSEECGAGFQEHYICVEGEVTCDECVDYYEYWIDDFDTKEEAEEEYGVEFTDEEWEEAYDCIYRGGFGSWDFTI